MTISKTATPKDILIDPKANTQLESQSESTNLIRKAINMKIHSQKKRNQPQSRKETQSRKAPKSLH